MLDFIISSLNDRSKNIPKRKQPDVTESEYFVECAHLFQELEELSIEGDKGPISNRNLASVIDIPLSNDVELETVEFDILDGRVTDVPMDASIQESYYEKMKTYDDFYQEACDTVPRLIRESDSGYQSRIVNEADRLQSNYNAYIIQEGLFGFDKISIDDDRVPANVTVSFGPMKAGSKDPYYVKLPVFFQIDKKRRITKKQLDAINKFAQGRLAESLGEFMTESVPSEYNIKIKENETLWNYMTPIKAQVPVLPLNEYKIIVVFECDFSTGENDNLLYYSISVPVKSGPSHGAKPDIKAVTNNATAKNMFSTFRCKKDIIKESMEIKRHSYSRFYQEAIDFGEGDDTTPPEADNNNEDNGPGVSLDDQSTTPDEASTSAEPEVDDDKVPVEANDVSGQIANKVSDETTDEANNDDTDDPINDNDDTTTDDTTSSDTTADNLDDLDDKGNQDLDDSSDGSALDFDNMTIDELLAHGSDKLKGMTLQQLKDFLNSGDVEALQEAFFLTTKNINTEIEVHLKTALGILNDNEMSVEQLIAAFKKEGKKLNKILSKASKMSKVYSSEEMSEIKTLNKCLVDVITTLKLSKQDTYLSTIKRLIQAFTSQSVVVSKIIDSKKPTKKDDGTTQESFIYDADGNIIMEYKVDENTGEIKYSTLEKLFQRARLPLSLLGIIVSFSSFPLGLICTFFSIGTRFGSFIYDNNVIKKSYKQILKGYAKYIITEFPKIQTYDDIKNDKEFVNALQNLLVVTDYNSARTNKKILKEILNEPSLKDSFGKLLTNLSEFIAEIKKYTPTIPTATLSRNKMQRKLMDASKELPAELKNNIIEAAQKLYDTIDIKNSEGGNNNG